MMMLLKLCFLSCFIAVLILISLLVIILVETSETCVNDTVVQSMEFVATRGTLIYLKEYGIDRLLRRQ